LEEEEMLLVARGAAAAPSWLGSREKRGGREVAGRKRGGRERNGGWRVARLAAVMRVARAPKREIDGEGGCSNEEREEERGWRLGFK
jgi:hypothetical protein